LWTDEDRFYAQLCSATIDEAGAEVSLLDAFSPFDLSRGLISPRVVSENPGHVPLPSTAAAEVDFCQYP